MSRHYDQFIMIALLKAMTPREIAWAFDQDDVEDLALMAERTLDQWFMQQKYNEALVALWNLRDALSIYDYGYQPA